MFYFYSDCHLTVSISYFVFIIIRDDNNVLASHSSRCWKSGYPLQLDEKKRCLKKTKKISSYFLPSFLPSFSSTHPCFRMQHRVESWNRPDSKGGFHVTGTGAKGSRVVLSSLPANSSLQHSHTFSPLQMTENMSGCQSIVEPRGSPSDL